ncbi:hypothetical protein HDU84_004004 [Entophlyctis sp. JEL0112]|nr:hypothetical protein HDU84_004004 [Entophlyctis sp. JEL0112]
MSGEPHAYVSDDVPVQWLAWLSHTRADAPTKEEIVAANARKAEIQRLAKEFEAKDAAMRIREQEKAAALLSEAEALTRSLHAGSSDRQGPEAWTPTMGNPTGARVVHYLRLSALLVAASRLKRLAIRGNSGFVSDERNVWRAIMAEVDLLHSLQAPRVRQALSDSQVLQLISSTSLDQFTRTDCARPTSMPMTSTRRNLHFPNELITAIASLVPTSCLYHCALVSRRWNNVITPILYGDAVCPTVSSISKLLYLCQQSNVSRNLRWKYSELAKAITFSQPVVTINAPGIEESIIETQSSLFRLFVLDRANQSWSFVHPILSRFFVECGKLDMLQEQLTVSESEKRSSGLQRNNTASQPNIPAQLHEDAISNQSPATGFGSSQSIPIDHQSSAASISSSNSRPQSSSRIKTDCLSNSNSLLSNLAKLCKRVVKLSVELGIDSQRTLDFAYYLLALFESFDRAIWGVSRFTIESFRLVKENVFEKLKQALKPISTAVLIEVQYISVSSQRLLDAYCMMYYRALAHANALNLSIILDILQRASLELKSQQNPSTNTNVAVDRHNLSRKPSHRILQALHLLFHRNLFRTTRNESSDPPSGEPAEAENYDTLGGLLESRYSLREGLMSFAPGSLNSETAEFIEQLLEFNDELAAALAEEYPNDPNCENIEIAKCIRWMKEVVRWQRAGRQMEPVKDLLRRSMARIDRLRNIQRRFGIQFMD